VPLQATNPAHLIFATLPLKPRGRHDAQNRDGPQVSHPYCPTVQIPARIEDEKDALLGIVAAVDHNRLQCLAFAYRRYQRTQRTMISASKCRPLNSAGRFRFIQAEAYQTSRTPLQHIRFANTDSAQRELRAMKVREAQVAPGHSCATRLG
jgi:hypothetical protein